MEKATHEAKQHTSWISPDAAYDSATQSFVRHVLKPGSKFVQSFRTFHDTVLDWGLWTALSQVALKFAAPGTPDLYQGQEIWDFSLVDPDNRRPVDFGKREWLLGEMEAMVSEGADALGEFAHQLAIHPRDDRLKMFVTWRLLQWRRQFAAELATAEYVPIRASGAKADHVVAFLWRKRQPPKRPFLLMVVPRWLAIFCPDGGPPTGRPLWEDTHILLESPSISTPRTLSPGSRFSVQQRSRVRRRPVVRIPGGGPGPACRSSRPRPVVDKASDGR